ncbi:uncharacterized protein Dwil_GK27221 [Drosophila willistoni]|uniref:Uncharacterized protein n=1 Tax=Drosophila willistoni TaxID=7260 RepID=A0A0Q9WZ61_DROWI|nr:uncharacterized protein LOC26529223 [Drosophila willistoni]KRF97708.1 uncharacterized protein Dwil_GK27221 [Drosophila willistoni]
MTLSSFAYEYSERDLLSRKARWLPLIYPRSHPARLQLIAGFGIPVDNLKLETIVTGYVLKAQYILPYAVEQLRTKNVHELSERNLPNNATIFQKIMAKSDIELGLAALPPPGDTQSGYRWALYQSFETLAYRMKLNGRVCVLKSICESAAAPFDQRNGLLGELLHIFLTPSTSMDTLSEHSDNDYLQAEHLGNAGSDCDKVYKMCPKSLLEHFSDVHHLGSEFLKILG